MLVVVFAAFVLGLFLMGALWCIYTQTGTNAQTLTQNDFYLHDSWLLKHACWLSGRRDLPQRDGIVEITGQNNGFRSPPTMMEQTSNFFEVN